MGLRFLRKDHAAYTTCRFLISGTCKQETVEEHQKFLDLAVKVVKKEATKWRTRLYFVMAS